MVGYNMETDFRILRLDRICERTRDVREIRRAMAAQIRHWRRLYHVDAHAASFAMVRIRLLKWVLNHDTRRF